VVGGTAPGHDTLMFGSQSAGTVVVDAGIVVVVVVGVPHDGWVFGSHGVSGCGVLTRPSDLTERTESTPGARSQEAAKSRASVASVVRSMVPLNLMCARSSTE
jgi:hypothetical protein